MNIEHIEDKLNNELNRLGFYMFLGQRALTEKWKRLYIKDCSIEVQKLVEQIEKTGRNVFIYKEPGMQQPVIDCNNCISISITENEQRLEKDRTGLIHPHICLKYKEQLYHKTASKNHYRIIPCEQCDKITIVR